MFAILPLILPLISSVLGKLIPDAGQAAQVQAELQKALIERQGEIDKAIADAAKAQSDVNLEEAKSSSMFVAGWRPFVGWVCGFGLVYSVVAPAVHLPPVDSGTIVPVLLGMLGLGGLRTFEKVQGVPDTTIRPILRRTK